MKLAEYRAKRAVAPKQGSPRPQPSIPSVGGSAAYGKGCVSHTRAFGAEGRRRASCLGLPSVLAYTPCPPRGVGRASGKGYNGGKGGGYQ